MMDKNRAFLLWIAIAGGGFLLFAAYKGQSPTELLSNYANQPAGKDLGKSSPDPATPVGSDHVSANFTSDSNGYTVEIPPAYKNSPGTFIPSPFTNNG